MYSALTGINMNVHLFIDHRVIQVMIHTYNSQIRSVYFTTISIIGIYISMSYVANPTFTTPVSSEVAVTGGDDVIFNCKGEGMPTVTYEWFYQNETGEKNKLFVG